MSALLPPGGRVLELGAGTGEQAQWLARQGFDVVAVDLPSSEYAAHRVFPVVDYDGRNIPLPSSSVDCVFSSNVLEHVRDLDVLFAECRRVLRPQGWMVHIVPTAAWRFWTLIGGFADLPAGVAQAVQSGRGPLALARAVAARVLPVRHGERGNAFTELATFRMAQWRKVFLRAGWRIAQARPMGLFYSGWMALGPRLSLTRREKLARVLGSACAVFVVLPSRR
ncbi:MAG: class I SAM-dependent methyltransferase [Elioraea sp.]|nr:class I SAM-dependent methyltransferase [Elioraea sp.]